MSRLPWILGSGVAAVYLWTHATKPHAAIALSPSSPNHARNARGKKDHPDLVSVVAHSRSWPGTSVRPR